MFDDRVAYLYIYVREKKIEEEEAKRGINTLGRKSTLLNKIFDGNESDGQISGRLKEHRTFLFVK